MDSVVNRHRFRYVTIFLMPIMAMSLSGWATESRTFELEYFERIYFTGIGTLHLIQGDIPSAVAVGEASALDELLVDSSDGILYIDSEAPNIATDDLVIDITVSRLRELTTDGLGIVDSKDLVVDDLLLEGRGAGRFRFSNLQANELTVTGRGSTDFEFSGKVERQIVAIDGVGNYRAPGLASRSGEISVFGSGDVLLWVEELLDVKIAGAARVRYRGTPLVLQEILGLGTVTKAE